MKIEKKILAQLLLIILLSTTARADNALHDAAESDQIRISAFVKAHYAGYVENYLKVFIGHFKCDYDFVNEAEFNDLADDALESLSASVRTLLSNRLETTASPLSPGQLDYTSTLVALSVIDAYAERYTADLDRQYEAGTLDCEETSEANNVLYNSLPATLAEISALSIP